MPRAANAKAIINGSFGQGLGSLLTSYADGVERAIHELHATGAASASEVADLNSEACDLYGKIQTLIGDHHAKFRAFCEAHYDK